jgi:hypothetical protein
MRTTLFAALTAMSLLFLFSSCEQTTGGDESPVAEASGPAAEALPDTSLAGPRTVVKTAELSLEVDRLEPAIQDVRALLQPLGGHIFHYEMEQSELSRSENACHPDSVRQVRTFSPSALLKVKVPAERADSFIGAVLQMDGMVQRFYSDEEDITEDLGEKRDLMLSGIPGRKTGNRTEAETGQLQEFIHRKADFARSAYRSRFLWFDVRMQARPLTRVDILPAAKPYHTPFAVNAREALLDGWYGLASGVALLLRIWPLWLLLLAILWFNRGRMAWKPAAARKV